MSQECENKDCGFPIVGKTYIHKGMKLCEDCFGIREVMIEVKKDEKKKKLDEKKVVIK